MKCDIIYQEIKLGVKLMNIIFYQTLSMNLQWRWRYQEPCTTYSTQPKQQYSLRLRKCFQLISKLMPQAGFEFRPLGP